MSPPLEKPKAVDQNRPGIGQGDCELLGHPAFTLDPLSRVGCFAGACKAGVESVLLQSSRRPDRLQWHRPGLGRGC
jgi:hypothetical protein